LWSFAATDGIIAQPATFNSSNGHQYLAVMTGLGGGFGVAERNMLDPLDQSAGLGLVAALSRLPTPRERSATLYLFRLP
ncbi:MAG: PQQ-dependent dehydrogenase, methanol/ethanol family, partial [Hyphomicrobiales bacterium]|nr:PQQ-dependent dehydrogenase, methanol/ethanol family [Hyphomicrobiales bacterium]